jgi:undecaprenyl-diphosphatase
MDSAPWMSLGSVFTAPAARFRGAHLAHALRRAGVVSGASPLSGVMDLYLLFVAILLGIVEGATEFIPVSSTGHLIIVSDWLGYEGRQATVFAVFIQLGAILAIVWLYRRTLLDVLGNWRDDPGARRFLWNVAIATIPAAAVGFLAHGFIVAHLFSPITVAGALMVGGIVILLIERWCPPTRFERVSATPLRTALGVGLAQVLALFPGVSRAGATIMGAYALGMSRTAATEFSFFLAIPIMVAASAYELKDTWSLLTLTDYWVLAVGFVVSFLAAAVAVKVFLRFVAMHTFRFFAWYRIALGALLLVYYGALR